MLKILKNEAGVIGPILVIVLLLAGLVTGIYLSSNPIYFKPLVMEETINTSISTDNKTSDQDTTLKVALPEQSPSSSIAPSPAIEEFFCRFDHPCPVGYRCDRPTLERACNDTGPGCKQVQGYCIPL